MAASAADDEVGRGDPSRLARRQQQGLFGQAGDHDRMGAMPHVLVLRGVGVAVVSELDAVKYVGAGLDFRPFFPVLPHTLSLVRPIQKAPSLVTLEFIEHFRDSLKTFTCEAVA